MKYLLLLSLLCVCKYSLSQETTQKPADTTQKPADTTQKPADTTHNPLTTPHVTVVTTTLAPEQECHANNGSCKECVGVGSGQCVWCDSNKRCLLKKSVVPTDECGLADAKWGVCWVNYEALIIAASVVGGLLILGITVCICCCCCCKNNKAKYVKEDAKYERKRADLKVKHDERRTERKEKTDEIRRKYGLIKDDNPYTKFDSA